MLQETKGLNMVYISHLAVYLIIQKNIYWAPGVCQAEL